MKKLLCAAALTLTLASNAFAGVSATSIKLKIYGVWLSTSQLCTNPINVFTVDNPDFSDFLDSPKLGQGVIPDGSYECVIIKFLDSIKFTPAQAEGAACVQGTEYAIDVCRGQNSQAPDGSNVACTGTTSYAEGTDLAYMYLSTGSTGSFGTVDAFNPPANSGQFATKGLRLNGAFVVRNGKAGTFNVNSANKVQTEDDGGTPRCGMDPPVFSFL